MRTKDKELRTKDEEHQGDSDKMKAEILRKDEEHRVVLATLADKDKEIMELRRRLPRVAEGEV